MRRVAVGIIALSAAAAAMAFTSGTSASVAPLDEAGVVAIFDLANTADIETGRLAADGASNKEVKDYGVMLAQVHTEVRQKGRDLAAKIGVTPALPANDQSAQNHAAAMTRLKALKGAEFDKAFLQHEREFHAAVLAAVKSTLLPAIKNQELKDFVVSLAPAFEAHRLMAAHLEKKLGFRE